MSSQDPMPIPNPENEMNWADYLDSLAQPTQPELFANSTHNRRLRDRFRNPVAAADAEKRLV